MLVLDYSLRIVVAAAAVGLVLALLRVRSGAARHAAWTAVLVAMLMMPVLTAVLPRLEVPVPSSLTLDPGTITDTYADVPVSELEVASQHGPKLAAITTSTTPRATAAQTSASHGITWPRLAVVAYSAGVFYFVLRLAVGWSLARRLVATGARVRLSDCRVVESSAVAAPLTSGVLSPTIVLPSGWRTWTADTMRAVLAHEQAHVVRRDPLVLLLAQMNRAIFWFHPLAWWLVRAISTNAEHACDECVVRQVGEPRRYAEILIEMAAAVNARGSRVAWPAVGVGGSGFLGARVDRLLRGDVLTRMSLSRRVAMTTACGAALLLAIACRQQVAATPLKEDPETARRLAETARATQRFESSRDMTTEQVDALEARIVANPEDWDARERLVIYYRAGTRVPWERKVPGLRRHALWLIEHHPEHDVAAPSLSPEYDPEGFATAVRLWDAHLEEPDVSPFLVSRAATFFAPYDRPRAEALILRGMAMDPTSEALKGRMPENTAGYEWPSQLASLYAAALAGVRAITGTDIRVKAAHGPFSADLRQKLAASDDAELLARVGSNLLGQSRFMRDVSADTGALGQSYIDRAIALQPDSPVVRRAVANRARLERHQRVWAAINEGKPVAEEDRLDYLAQKAQHAYTLAEFQTNYRKDEAAAQRKLEEARATAEEALDVARRHPEAAEAGGATFAAHQTLALVELREGHRNRAVGHMKKSVNIPALDPDFDHGLGSRLSNYLLKEGERESVATYLEKYAALSPGRREGLLDDARAIREGRMPESYQRMFAASQPGK